MPVSKRVVLRAGFGIVLGLLIASTITAYRVQEVFSRRTVEIHKHYANEQELHTNLRRTLWAAGIAARDLFINPSPDRMQTYHNQLDQLKADSELYFAELSKQRNPNPELQVLQRTFNDLWRTLHDSADIWDEERQYKFVQEQIVPKRNEAGKLLRQIEYANFRALTESQEEFAQNRAAAAKRLLLLLGSVLLIGVLVARFSLKHFEALEQQTARQLEEVSQAKAELERLSARLMDIQEEERTRLSRELHDEIVQTLAVLKIEITQAQTPGKGQDVKENLARARDLVERTLRTVRNISLLLRPSLLDDLGLGPALQWLCEDFTRRTGVPCEFDEQGLSDDLPVAVKTAVYRVSQEALHNCEKHAAAAHVNLAVRQSESLTVEISDDGVGFHQWPAKGAGVNMHFGLIGMRERAAALGGSLLMDSSPGKGTKVRLWVPLTSYTKQPELQELRHASTM